MDVLTILLAIFNAVFKLAVIAFAGFFATKTSGFTPEIRKGFSTIVFHYFLTAVIFSQTATSMDTIITLVEWWFLPFAGVIVFVIAFPAMYIIGKLFKLDTKTRRVFVYSISFGNTMYIPLALVDSITSETDLFGDNGKEKGGAYICAYLIATSLIYWIFGYTYIQKNQVATDEENKKQIKLEDELLTVQHEDSTKVEKNELNTDAEQKSLTNEKSQVDTKEIPQTTLLDEETKLSIFKRHLSNLYEKVKHMFSIVHGLYLKYIPASVRLGLSKLVNPPTLATIFGLFMVIINPVRDLFFDGGKFDIIGRTLSYIGSAAVICALFILGGNLSSGPRGGKIRWYVIIIGLFTRLVIVPAICIGINYLLWYYKFIPTDNMFFFIVSIEACTPPALNSSLVMNMIYPDGNEECGSLLFFAYLSAIATLSGWMAVIMLLIQTKPN
ncbi:hypothetical protein EIN_410550 [Entamoeba invadens IP1]|uniref:Auxin efflux carrier family protein n=1 Tax=Entamoeba invadens IP1 TaxID=370355 RepID=A0A0A1U101_ENTIV|nr:hypothetical protein EIN_410550 [Entamoeba invadens IP1]ELP87722.1 hypothetical protein EIN_410550 [Entamoeba invadens IP1]|eukprot:XP_004254493.1 hypothetical protein EIN_410550 [Entamoeba invadens IP1]